MMILVDVAKEKYINSEHVSMIEKSAGGGCDVLIRGTKYHLNISSDDLVKLVNVNLPGKVAPLPPGRR